MSEPRFALIGAGRMATALAKGMLSAGLFQVRQLAASDPSPAAAKAFHEATGVAVAKTNLQAVAGADVVLLAVKPQHVAEVLHDLRGDASGGKLVVSIAAGVTLATLAEGLGPRARLVRVMPNTPCLVSEGASAYCLGPGATEDDGRLVERLLSSVGQVHRVPESLLDAVTGLSGSGPAFVCLFIEALSDGGVKMGLPRSVALALAAQTVKGAAAMVLATGEHPAVLKDQVASPGGTTIAGLHALESGGFRAAVLSAVEAATRRSAELGRGG
jgi:pyrroline-5-carboxylate reductase